EHLRLALAVAILVLRVATRHAPEHVGGRLQGATALIADQIPLLENGQCVVREPDWPVRPRARRDLGMGLANHGCCHPVILVPDRTCGLSRLSHTIPIDQPSPLWRSRIRCGVLANPW